jgi:hypothetical protein
LSASKPNCRVSARRYLISILERLNPQQRRAAEHALPFQVGCDGSGFECLFIALGADIA